MEMIIEQLDERLTRITLDGRMDMQGTQAIDQRFAIATATKALRLGVDLTNVSFVASIGLRTFMVAARAQAGRGGKLVLVGPNDMVRKILETAGIDTLVPIFDDWESAQAALLAA